MNPATSAIARLAALMVALGAGLMLGCATPPPAPEKPMATEFSAAPNWVRGNCEAYWEGNPGSRICGVGAVAGTSNPAVARSLAIARARTEIAQTLETRVEGILKDNESLVTEDTVTRYVNRFESQTKESTGGTISGSKLQASWVSPNGTYYAMVSLDLAPIETAIKQDLSPAETQRQDLDSRADAAFSELDAATNASGEAKE